MVLRSSCAAHFFASTLSLASDPRLSFAQIIATEPSLPEFALLRLNTARYRNVRTEYGAVWDSMATLKVREGNQEAVRYAGWATACQCGFAIALGGGTVPGMSCIPGGWVCSMTGADIWSDHRLESGLNRHSPGH